MSVGSLQGCASTLSEVMQENRLEQLNTPVDNQLTSSNSAKNLRFDVEPASIDTNAADTFSSTKQVNPTSSVNATEPISNSIIESTLASNKSTNNNYLANGQQSQSNLTSGLLIDLKV